MKERGVDEVIVYCVNDAAVMEAWAKDQGIEGSMITFLGDPTSVLTKALDLELTDSGPTSVLGPGRCKRFAMVCIVETYCRISNTTPRIHVYEICHFI